MDRLDRDVVHEICTNQVVVTLHACVKELVENSLDAGATRIEVKLRESGSELLEVVDNGCGIKPQDYARVATRHATSKIREYEDLSHSLDTFGFRGEALAAICAMGDTTVCTRTSEDGMAALLAYDRFGKLTSQTPAAREVGTTISVRELFKRLPVRHREFMRNAKAQVSLSLRLIQAYAIAQPDIRFHVVAEKLRGHCAGRATLLSTSGNSSGWCQAAASVLGDAILAEVKPLEIPRTEGGWSISGAISMPTGGRRTRDSQLFFVNRRPVDPPKRISKLINDTYHQYNSKLWPVVILSFTAPQELVDVNVTPDKRTVFLHNEEGLLADLQQGLTELWAPAASGPRATLTSFGFQGAGSALPADSRLVAQCLGQAGKAPAPLEDFGQPAAASRDAYPGSSVGSEAGTPELGLRGQAVDQSRDLGETPEKVASKACLIQDGRPGLGSCPIEEVSRSDMEPPKRPRLAAPDSLAVDYRESVLLGCEITLPPEDGRQSRAGEDALRRAGSASTVLQESPRLGVDADLESTEEASAAEAAAEARAARTLAAGQALGPSCQAHVALAELEAAVRRRRAAARTAAAARAATGAAPAGAAAAWPPQGDEAPPRPPAAAFPSAFSLASLEDGAAAVEAVVSFGLAGGALEEAPFSFDRGCFSRMRVIGQFNLGFIIAALPTWGSSQGQDEGDAASAEVDGLQLFIVDQHASDEKFRFEALNRDSKIDRQPLMMPRPIQLTPAQEAIAESHLELFRLNGFDLTWDSSRPPGRRLRLAALPTCQGMMFGEKDIHDLLFSLQEAESEQGGPRPQAAGAQDNGRGGGGLLDLAGHRGLWSAAAVLRPPKVWQLLACRACRGAVMIGKALRVSEMEQILRNLGGLQQPWNCPHGRPTMRHLVDARVARKAPRPTLRPEAFLAKRGSTC